MNDYCYELAISTKIQSSKELSSNNVYFETIRIRLRTAFNADDYVIHLEQ